MNFWESGFDTKPMSIGKITQEMYEKLRKTIPERHTFYLNVTTNTLTATPMPSPQHEAILDVITRMRGTLDDWLSTVSPGYSIIVFGAPRLPLFDNTGLHILGKEPDISIGLQHSDDHIMDEIARWGYPPIVVEIGYTETHNQLVNDARDWLLFSAGKILSVIVFKLTKPVGEEDSLDPLKWGLFAELYERYVTIHLSSNRCTHTWIRDHHNNVVRYGDRIKILPRPDVPPTLKLLPRHILPTTAPIISNIEFECAIHQSALTRSMKLAIAWARRYAEARADGGAGES
jgi:hypothetical protein